MTFAYDISRLTFRKAQLGWTDMELARRARVSPTTVKNVLTGRSAKGGTIKALAEALGLNLADLVVASGGQS